MELQRLADGSSLTVGAGSDFLFPSIAAETPAASSAGAMSRRPVVPGTGHLGAVGYGPVQSWQFIRRLALENA